MVVDWAGLDYISVALCLLLRVCTSFLWISPGKHIQILYPTATTTIEPCCCCLFFTFFVLIFFMWLCRTQAVGWLLRKFMNKTLPQQLKWHTEALGWMSWSYILQMWGSKPCRNERSCYKKFGKSCSFTYLVQGWYPPTHQNSAYNICGQLAMLFSHVIMLPHDLSPFLYLTIYLVYYT